MKLKYYLRGMGIGIILTAIVMGFALGGRKAAISDAEVIQRAKALGMVEHSGTLTQATWEATGINEEVATASGEELLSKGDQISQEDQQEASETALSNPGLAEAAQEIQDQSQETAGKTGEASFEGAAKQESDVAKEIVETKTLDDAASSDTAGAGSTTAIAAAETSALTDASSAKASAETTLQISDAAVPVADAASASSSAAVAAATNTVADTGAEAASASAASTSASTASASAASTESSASAASPAPAVASRSVTIPKGCGSDTVADILFKEGLVDNAVSFNQFLVTTGMDRKLRAGVKLVPEDGDYQHIAEVLIQG